MTDTGGGGALDRADGARRVSLRATFIAKLNNDVCLCFHSIRTSCNITLAHVQSSAAGITVIFASATAARVYKLKCAKIKCGIQAQVRQDQNHYAQAGGGHLRRRPPTCRSKYKRAARHSHNLMRVCRTTAHSRCAIVLFIV